MNALSTSGAVCNCSATEGLDHPLDSSRLRRHPSEAEQHTGIQALGVLTLLKPPRSSDRLFSLLFHQKPYRRGSEDERYGGDKQKPRNKLNSTSAGSQIDNEDRRRRQKSDIG